MNLLGCKSRHSFLLSSVLFSYSRRYSSVSSGLVPCTRVERSAFIRRGQLSKRLVASRSFLSMATGNVEVAAAKAAAASAASDGGAPTVFDKILSGEWSSDKVHEDDQCLAFRDINPQGPVHVIVIPKNRDGLTMLSKAREDQKGILGHLLYVAKEVGKKECPSGFRIVINDGEHGAQSVYHLHLHVIGKIEMHYLYLQSFGT